MNDYEGYESWFESPADLERYRAMLLAKTAEQSEFIRQIVGRGMFSAYELCCGNGRLLIDLAKRGWLTHGAGVDSAASRVEFGRQWCHDLGLGERVDLHCADVLEWERRGEFDVSLCITGAFQYFPRVACPGDGMDIMIAMESHAPICILELYNIPMSRKTMLYAGNGHIKTWDILPEGDPFAYYLDSYTYNETERVMRHEKVFIGRKGGIDSGRVETLYYYTPKELLCLMQEVGYKDIQFYADWKGNQYNSGSEELIVVGKR